MAWDAIVIGGGHNGLVAGAYLARAGARTVVLEARSKTGGAAATDAPWPEAPDIKVTRLSYVMSLMPPRIIRDLELERHGYKLHPMGPAYPQCPLHDTLQGAKPRLPGRPLRAGPPRRPGARAAAALPGLRRAA